MEFVIIAAVIAILGYYAFKAISKNDVTDDSPSDGYTDISPIPSEPIKETEDEPRNVYQFSVNGAVSTSYAEERRIVPTQIQPRRYSLNNHQFACWGKHSKYSAYLRNELMKPKELNVTADSWDALMSLVEEIHRFRAKRESNPDYIEMFSGDFPANPALKFPLAGNEHRRPKAQKMFANMKHGEKVLLVKEPTNPADSHAVKVLAQDGEHLGYVSAGKATRVGELIKTVGYAWLERQPTELTGRFLIFLDYLEYDERSDGYDYPDPVARFTEQEE